MAVLTRSCERARTWISLDLDDELSELEQAMLRRHVRSCAACAGFQADAASITGRLRLAPLEPVPAPVVLPARRRSVVRLVQIGAAAAVAIAAAGIGTLLSSPDGPPVSMTAPLTPQSISQPGPAVLDGQALEGVRTLKFRHRVGIDPGRMDI